MAPDVFFWLQHVFSSSSVSTEFKIARIPCEGFLAMPASIVYVYVVGVHKDTLEYLVPYTYQGGPDHRPNLQYIEELMIHSLPAYSTYCYCAGKEQK
jgi:hypothetical protein